MPQKSKPSESVNTSDIVVPAPPDVPPSPDADTSMFPDFTEPGSPGKVFGFEFLGFKYGSSDKIHSAAFLLSILIVFTMMVMGTLSLFAEHGDRVSDLFQVLGQVLILTIGVAIGRGAQGNSDGN